VCPENGDMAGQWQQRRVQRLARGGADELGRDRRGFAGRAPQIALSAGSNVS
jgi:hypothetical protein